MNKKSFFKRCIAAVLSVAFIIGVIPANAIYISWSCQIWCRLLRSRLMKVIWSLTHLPDKQLRQRRKKWSFFLTRRHAVLNL